MNLAAANRLSGLIVTELAPFCERIEVAGSIRRHQPEIGDVDLVCLPKGENGLHDLIERCLRSARCIKTGEQYRVFELRGGVQLDLWIAHAGVLDLLGNETPPNWTSLLICRTGSKAFNIHLAQCAQRQGLHWNPHAGLMKPTGRAFVDGRGPDGRRQGGVVTLGTWIDTPTEGEFFRALHLDYLLPEEREF